jgi:hypothetical protein
LAAFKTKKKLKDRNRAVKYSFFKICKLLREALRFIMINVNG